MSKRTKWLMAIGIIATLIVGFQVVAYANLTGSDFEGGDGNLVVNTTGNTDWNRFAPPFWTGQTANGPLANYRITNDTDAGGWDFFGMLDEFKGSGNNNADSIYAGGTKQSDDCPTLVTKSAPNKDDLKRVYLSTKRAPVSGTDHVFLNLGWVRIPLNTTQSSAHVAFEFNQNQTACTTAGNHTDPAGRSLVPRSTANGGDLLVQYDFEGGTATPTISISRWKLNGAPDPAPTPPDQPANVDCSGAPACWSPPDQLSPSQAEAAVNQAALTGATNGDRLAPPGPSTQGGAATPADVGALEFGEAGVDLTAAGVFPAGQCVSFGKVSASSRSSGNSNSSNMFDIAGPGNFTLQNCGSITIEKKTNPEGLDADFPFTSSNSTLAGTCKIGTTTDSTPGSFTLNDKSADTDSMTCTDVPAGTHTVTEGTEASGFKFNNFSCTSSGTGTSTTPTSSTTQKNVSITMAGGGNVTCVYTNDQQLGAIKITKNSIKTAGTPPAPIPLAGAKFSITKGGTAITGSPFTTGADGTVCVDNLAFGDYVVTETQAPAGYAIDTPAGQTVTVDNNAKCSDASFGGETKTFTDTPLTDVVAKATSQAAGGTASRITCVDSSNANIGDSPKPSASTFADPVQVTANGLSPGTYTCTIVIDP